MLICCDQDKYTELLREAIYNDPATFMNIRKGHTLALHEELTDLKMCERIIHEEKNYVSCFQQDDFDEAGNASIPYLQDTIDYAADDIYNWLTSRRNEFKNERDYNELTINLKLSNEPIGRGYNSELQEMETSYINVALSRDYSGENNFGFYVKTAYADLTKGHLTGREMNMDDLEKNSRLSPWEILKKDINREYKKVFCRLEEDKVTGNKGIRYSKALSPDEKIVIYHYEDKKDILYFDLDKKTTLNISELQELNSDMYRLSVYVDNKYEIIKQFQRINAEKEHPIKEKILSEPQLEY